MDKLRELNKGMVEANGELLAANREQTKRCRRMLGAVRLLGDVMEQAEPVECGDTGEVEYIINSELYEQMAAWLADFTAEEAEAGEGLPVALPSPPGGEGRAGRCVPGPPEMELQFAEGGGHD